MKIRLQCWPWQQQKPKWLGRFGGGYQYCLGLRMGGHTLLIDLVWGRIRIDL